MSIEFQPEIDPLPLPSSEVEQSNIVQFPGLSTSAASQNSVIYDQANEPEYQDPNRPVIISEKNFVLRLFKNLRNATDPEQADLIIFVSPKKIRKFQQTNIIPFDTKKRH